MNTSIQNSIGCILFMHTRIQSRVHSVLTAFARKKTCIQKRILIRLDRRPEIKSIIIIFNKVSSIFKERAI